MGQWKQRLAWVLVLLESPGLGLGFPGGGGQHRPRLGLTRGCFSLRGRRRAGARSQKAVGVLGKRRMEGWSDNLCLDDCGVKVLQGLSQLAPGSSLSGVEVNKGDSL